MDSNSANASLTASEASNSGLSVSRMISVPSGTSITVTESNAKAPMGNQVSITGSPPILVNVPPVNSGIMVANPVVASKAQTSSSSVIAYATANRNSPLVNTYPGILPKLAEVDIQEIPEQPNHDDGADNQNGGSNIEMTEDPIFSDANMDEYTDVAASKTQYVCDGCGKGFCYIGWLDRHKSQSKACRNASTKTSVTSTATLNAIAPTTSTTVATSSAISTGADQLSVGYAKSGIVQKSDFSLLRRDRDRQSLQGRLQDLLQCPHPQCTFATYWLQSLTKHVNYTCKFGAVMPQNAELTTPATNITQPSVASKIVAPVTCTICSKKCSDVQEHIDHMTSVHRMKASYRCSTCAQTFPTKLAVEAHLQTHTKVSGNQAANPPSVHYSLESSSNSQSSQGSEKMKIGEETPRQRKQSFENPTTSIEIAEEEDDNFTAQNDVFKCNCGKVYLQISSYEQHLKTCGALTPSTPVTAGTEGETDEMSRKRRRESSKTRTSLDSLEGEQYDHVGEHFKHEHIQAIHGDDYRCKCCQRDFPSCRSLSNHLCRTECRALYFTKLLPEVPGFQKTDVTPTMSKRQRYASGNSHKSEVVREVKEDGGSPLTTEHRRRAASIAAQSTLKLSLSGHYVESKEAPSNASERPMGQPIQCPKCFRVFSGKSPHVAFNNHLRRQEPCVPDGTVKRNLLLSENQPPFKPQLHQQNQQLQQSPTQISFKQSTSSSFMQYPHSKIKNLSASGERNSANQSAGKVNLEAIQQGVKYYCKLCPNREIKNRVSLGCHLTIYHGLPQVNVATEHGDSFRCQTCRHVFTSKYFYNMHRYDCDLTSPYVGVLNDDGDEATPMNTKPPEPKKTFLKQPHKKEERRYFGEKKQLGSASFFPSSYKCSLCNKSGFWGPNAVKIHQKYQCVKRQQIPAVKGHYATAKKFVQREKFETRVMDNQEKGSTSGPDEESSESRLFMAKMNDLAKKDATLTMCDACGRGPYNSYYYFLEHKRQFCRALKGRGKPQLSSETTFGFPTKAVKSIGLRRPNIAKKSLPSTGCAFISPQTARKTFQSHNVTVENEEKQQECAVNEEEDEAAAATAVDNVGDEPQDQIVKCSICNKELENIEKFIRHRLKHITSEINESSSSEPLKCEICNAKISHYQRMQQHLILHLQNFTVIRQKDLIEVKRKKPTDDESDDDADQPMLTCPYCKANFVSRIHLANHIRNTCHSRYQCPQCKRTYLTKESLNEHKDQCIRNAALRSVSLKSAFKCRNCGLEFNVKQRLLWHEHACSKVYSADLAGRVEEIIQRTLTCGVCGMVSKDYENKLKHERRCLQRYLCDVGFRAPVIDDNESDIEPYEASSCDNLSSLKSMKEKLDEQTIKRLKEKYGIFKDLKVAVKKQEFTQYQVSDDESDAVKLEVLKEAFENILRLLINEEAVYEEVRRQDAPEVVLSRMLKLLGENPVEANGLNELTCFSQNLQTFLKLSIKEETLEKANHQAKSVEEVILNLLRFPYELK